MRHENGFTIIELMLTIAIAALLLTLGVPALQDMVRNNRLVGQTNNVVADIQLARAEAIKRNTQVIMCRSQNATTCAASAQDWTTGWVVLANGAAPPLRVGDPPGGGATVFVNSNKVGGVSFESDGTLAGNTPARFVVCDDRQDEQFGRQIDIGLMGHPTLIKGSSSAPVSDCGNPANP